MESRLEIIRDGKTLISANFPAVIHDDDEITEGCRKMQDAIICKAGYLLLGLLNESDYFASVATLDAACEASIARLTRKESEEHD